MIIREGKYDIRRYWFNLYFHTDTTIIRSSIIKDIPMSLLENNFNDNLITYSIMQNGKIYFIPKAMAVYSQTGIGIWTGENVIVNNIRNMFLYDLCIKINDKLKFQNDVRFYSTWKNLFSLRKKIDSKKLAELLREANDKNLRYSLLWLEYDNEPISKKIHLYFRFIIIFICSIIFRIYSKCIKLLKAVYHKIIHLGEIYNIYLQNLWRINVIKQENNICSNCDDNKFTSHENELGIEIAPVYGNKKGIVTIISDDGDYETSKILDMLSKKYNIPITIAGTAKNIVPHMHYWKKLIHEGSIEIVNHSYNHHRMDEDWKYSKSKKHFVHEIIHSRLFFERQLGIKDRVFVCPENAMNELGYDVIKEDEIIAVRRGSRGINSLNPKEGMNPGDWLNLMCYGIMDQPNSLETRREMRNKWLDKASQGNWLIEMWHNVDNIGYQTIDSKSAEEHLNDICEYRNNKNIWCTKFTDATKYLKEKESAVIHSWVENGKKMVYIWTPSYGEIFFHELTVVDEKGNILANLLPNKLYIL